MSSVSNAVWNGVAMGLYNTTNMAFGALTSRSMFNAGIDPFNTLYVNLDSPSGFSSWADPAYASKINVGLNAAGFDTTWAPLTSAITNSFVSNPLFGGGLFGFGFNNGFGFNSGTYISSYTSTPLGIIPGKSGWWC